MDTTVDHFTPLALRVRGNKELQSQVIKRIGKMCFQEIKHLCSDNYDSILRTTSDVAMTHFSWESIWIEISTKAPTLVTRSEKTYHFAHKLKKRYKQKSRKKSFFNPKFFLAYLKFQLLDYLLAKFQHLNRYSFAKRAAQRELLLFSSRGRLYVNCK